MKSMTEKYLSFIKAAAAAGLIIYLALYVDFDKIVSAALNANPFLLCAAFLAGAANIAIQYLKWKTICNESLGETNRGKIISSLFSGFSAGIITPLRAGEYFGRYNAINKSGIVPVACGVLVDKITLLYAEVTAGGIMSLIFIKVFISPSPALFFFYAFLFFTVSLLFTLIIIGNGPLFNFAKRVFKTGGKGGGLLKKLEAASVANDGVKKKITLLSFLQYGCFLSQYAVLVWAYTGEGKLTVYLLAGAFLFLAKNVISFLTPGELGTREGLSVFILSAISVNKAAAFNAALSLFFINILVPSILGLFFLLKKNDN
jgi:uncharacterized membrane protein YbhN (UPF0104 family)